LSLFVIFWLGIFSLLNGTAALTTNTEHLHPSYQMCDRHIAGIPYELPHNVVCGFHREKSAKAFSFSR